MVEAPMRVLIAGGGMAALETVMALRSLAGDRVAIALIAPDAEFVYHPIAAKAPYAVGRMRRIPLERLLADAGAQRFPLNVSAVDPVARVVRTTAGREFEYDELVLALGADPVPVVQHATTWDDRTGAETLGGLLRDFELGYSRSLAVVIPSGPVWPLRGYELALILTQDARGMGLEIETSLVTPERSPLEMLGDEAVTAISDALREAGVAVVFANQVEIEPGQPRCWWHIPRESGSTSIESSRCRHCAGGRSPAFRSRSTDSSKSTTAAASKDWSTSGQSETSPPFR